MTTSTSHSGSSLSRASFSGVRPIFRVSGVVVSPRRRTWRWRCAVGGPRGTRGCPEGEAATQDFLLEVRVRFEEMPLVWHHQNTSRCEICHRLSI